MLYQVRTVGTGDVLLVGADGTLLGTSTPERFPTARVGQPPPPPDILPGLEGPPHAALAGEEDPDRLYVTIEPDQHFLFIVPLRDEQDTQRILGAAVVYLEDLPTDRDLPADGVALVGTSLLARRQAMAISEERNRLARSSSLAGLMTDELNRDPFQSPLLHRGQSRR